MSYLLTNPGCYQGDPGNAPEFRSDSPVQCSTCHEEFDRDDDAMHTVFDRFVCRDCVEVCDMCGEYLDDAAFPTRIKSNPYRWVEGPFSIRFREYENNGRLSKDHCPMCAGEHLIGVFADDEYFALEAATKEQIATLLSAPDGCRACPHCGRAGCKGSLNTNDLPWPQTECLGSLVASSIRMMGEVTA